MNHSPLTSIPSPDIYSEDYLLTAGQCGAEGVMPVTMMVARAIEVATAHANLLGIGYAHLRRHTLAWVLSRMSVEVISYPGINSHYAVSTWLESWSRRLSERNFEVTAPDGTPYAHIRSVWAALDINSHTIGDLGLLGDPHLPFPDKICPILKAPRITSPADIAPRSHEYTFRYCDIDFNRHVNSVKYLNAILNCWDIDHYDRYAIKRLDVAYMSECRFGQTARINIWHNPDTLESICAIDRDDRRAVTVRILWHPRQNP